jgi:hypothetical protein
MQKLVSNKHDIWSYLSRLSRQGRNYLALVGWTLYTGFKGRTTKLSFAILLSFLSLACQAAAIGAIYWYGHKMEATGQASVPYLHIDVDLRERPEWLWGIVIFSTVCFLISAAFLYLARSQILNIAEQSYARKLEQLVLQSFRLPDSRARLASKLLMDVGMGGLMGGCQRGAIIAISFAYAATAVVGGIGAAAFLLWSEPGLTLLVFMCAGIAALFLYPLTLRAAKSAKELERLRGVYKKEWLKLAEQNSRGEPLEAFKCADELARAAMMRRRVTTEFVFAIQIGITFILAIVIYYLASEALAGGRERWVLFIAYVAALRLALTGIAQPIRAFAVVSRFYPQIVRYYLFARDMEKIDSVHFASLEPKATIILGLLANGLEVKVTAGNIVALLTHERLRNVGFALLAAKLPNSEAPLATAIIDPITGWRSDGAIAIVDAKMLNEDARQSLTLERGGAQRDKVTLIAYPNVEKVGMLGEERVLTFFEGEFQRFELLGTKEANAALEEFERKGKRARTDKVAEDLFEEGDFEVG